MQIYNKCAKNENIPIIKPHSAILNNFPFHQREVNNSGAERSEPTEDTYSGLAAKGQPLFLVMLAS